MSDLAEDFDPSPFVARESEVLAVFAQHIVALSPKQLHRLQDEGAVLMDLQALEAGDHFELRDLAVDFFWNQRSQLQKSNHAWARSGSRHSIG